MLHETSGRPTVVTARDARQAAGYGRISNKFQKPRQSALIYPYVEDEFPGLDDEMLAIDEETFEAIRLKTPTYEPSDSLAAIGTDRFYFVGGNTKLSDCFWRADKVLSEVDTFSDSMAPVPQAYKGYTSSKTGYGPAFPYPGGGGSNYKRTGTLRGWSKAPPPLPEFEDEEPEEVEVFFTLKDFAAKFLD